ncbi:HAD superfamily hydrolase (TIGR01509 family)/HAD superfamily hydrolase (TIGR01549 family) [Sinobacterium caligoides]|uniref:HAD superfamily hydrolase (TIGR01509 family)/HAD superfamily hydrolase (TIGR01549 family) n=1 Tax=Sinobacterium caligoides TaxID=933926 RepID=A0A3N2E087_9GAMM|nr:HAD family hydrolase [Sinobacterium caligoides]ROS05521.1 HAD superfamily hydrolase (TIGR01509 family)/HAD superfamily hydrolase (TIGR01549 family) [Sinobacterium caligoides]
MNKDAHSTIDTVIFDLDETLVVESKATDAAIHSTHLAIKASLAINADKLGEELKLIADEMLRSSPFREYCDGIGISALELMWVDDAWNDNTDFYSWACGFKYSVWGELLKKYNDFSDERVEYVSGVYLAQRNKEIIAFDEVISTLSTLHGKIKIGLLTNGLSELQSKKISASKLGRYFDQVLISSDFGKGKPSPEPYLKLLSSLNSSPKRTIMIGDNVVKDVNASINVGCHSLLINREVEESYITTPLITGVINSTDQLVELLYKEGHIV